MHRADSHCGTAIFAWLTSKMSWSNKGERKASLDSQKASERIEEASRSPGRRFARGRRNLAPAGAHSNWLP